MPQWRKLWVKATESLDINDMPDDFHRLLWLMMPLGLDCEGRGIDNPSWIKGKVMILRLDVTLEMIECAMCWYAQRGMVERYVVNGRRFFYLPSFRTYQGNTEREAKSQYPAPPVHSQDQPHDETQPESRPTHDLLMTNSRSDADIDTDVDVEERGAQPAPAAEPPPAEPKRVDIRSDPRSKHPAIQCVRGIMKGHYPPTEIYDDAIRILGTTPDGKRLADCRKMWVERGYNKGAWTWLTEWYVTGIPARGNGHGARASPAKHDATAADWQAEAQKFAPIIAEEDA